MRDRWGADLHGVRLSGGVRAGSGVSEVKAGFVATAMSPCRGTMTTGYVRYDGGCPAISKLDAPRCGVQLVDPPQFKEFSPERKRWGLMPLFFVTASRRSD